jgi:hypothetical protein
VNIHHLLSNGLMQYDLMISIISLVSDAFFADDIVVSDIFRRFIFCSLNKFVLKFVFVSLQIIVIVR